MSRVKAGGTDAPAGKENIEKEIAVAVLEFKFVIEAAQHLDDKLGFAVGRQLQEAAHDGIAEGVRFKLGLNIALTLDLFHARELKEAENDGKRRRTETRLQKTHLGLGC